MNTKRKMLKLESLNREEEAESVKLESLNRQSVFRLQTSENRGVKLKPEVGTGNQEDVIQKKKNLLIKYWKTWET